MRVAPGLSGCGAACIVSCCPLADSVHRNVQFVFFGWGDGTALSLTRPGDTPMYISGDLNMELHEPGEGEALDATRRLRPLARLELCSLPH